MAKIRKDTQGIIISKAVGKRKRLEIQKNAKESGIKVLNLNIEDSIKKIESFMSAKKKKEAKPAKKDITKESKNQENPKESKETKETTDEGKKETEKKERDKVLTKKV